MRKLTSCSALTLALAALLPPTPSVAADKPVIAIIGGPLEGAAEGEDDFSDGALKIERLLKAAPAFDALGAVVKTFPVGFPKNPAEIADATVVVVYAGLGDKGGPQRNAMLEPVARAALEKLVAKGAGLVALHQSSTVSGASGNAPLDAWLGAATNGTDTSTLVAPISLATSTHPVVKGVQPFAYLDEFFPKIGLGRSTKVTPLLHARLATQFRDGKPVFEQHVVESVVAWANERADGGRTVGYAGLHYLSALDNPNVRKVILNAILWAAKNDVPEGGVTTSLPVMEDIHMAIPTDVKYMVLTAEQVRPEPQPWGKLEWFASRPLGNSTKMTVGQATISPGKFNPPHWHPNCDEILHVLKGRIISKIGDKEFEMKAGDTMVIPEGVVHNARNIGTEDAVLAVSFNSADRYAVGEN